VFGFRSAGLTAVRRFLYTPFRFPGTHDFAEPSVQFAGDEINFRHKKFLQPKFFHKKFFCQEKKVFFRLAIQHKKTSRFFYSAGRESGRAVTAEKCGGAGETPA
jgi:hypothetical protein